MILSPTQLGVQLWEVAHASTGLPWWAAIPVATVGFRTVLMPLSLRAYAASSYLALLHRAFGLSREVGDAVAVAEAQERRQRVEVAASASVSEASAVASTSSDSSIGGSSGSSGGSNNDSTTVVDGARALGRMELVRHVVAHLRKESKLPSFAWYVANAAVQVPIAVSLTLALRRMCDSLWPGLTSEGVLFFTDLTAPPVYLQTLSTPYGTAGAILPLALMLLYSSAVDRSRGGSSPGINMALKLCAIPLYITALQQPHAVLLYWLSHAATQLGIYQVAALAEPSHGSSTAATAQTNQGGGSVDDLLLVLSDSYDKAGNKAAARACLQALSVRQPGLASVHERLKQLDK
ncbi:hypothetical protein HXX76_002352 [Chlamydomonas incerta]|uniref:Uncharacterized protein n=1 Tax=Chlamydomonas incerta TaxID=51695 RepID=A0A835TQK4_CHLIN|nr:hypothetical protein HXX76_002352 [Chlamydomonas incerta]|eukprot:KAG2442265.1 hypothetical protein HXX76_002352 [Chlamydomonas incerta]